LINSDILLEFADVDIVPRTLLGRYFWQRLLQRISAPQTHAYTVVIYLHSWCSGQLSLSSLQGR